MDEVMTMAELEARFPGEWVLVADPRTTKDLAVRSGRVVWHGHDQDEMYRKSAELRLRRFAVLFAGKIPEDIDFVL